MAIAPGHDGARSDEAGMFNNSRTHRTSWVVGSSIVWIRSAQRIVPSDGMDFRECFGNALSRQPTGAPTEATATEALGKLPVAALTHQVAG